MFRNTFLVVLLVHRTSSTRTFAVYRDILLLYRCSNVQNCVQSLHRRTTEARNACWHLHILFHRLEYSNTWQNSREIFLSCSIWVHCFKLHIKLHFDEIEYFDFEPDQVSLGEKCTQIEQLSKKNNDNAFSIISG